MAFVRSKSIKGKKYYYLVESYRINGGVHQKNLKYLGNVMPNKETTNELNLEFTEKKIQQEIRKNLKFKPDEISISFLEKADQLKEKFFGNLNKLSRQGKNQLIKRFKTGFTYHSCSIEGNTLSRQQIDMVINKNESVAGKKLIEIQEALNHKEAIEYLICENSDLSGDFIKRLHKVLTRDLSKFKLDPKTKDYDPDFIEGDYRTDQRFIEGADFIPTPPNLIEDEMKDLIKFYKENKYKIHPLELASKFHLRFVIIHPFSDGNGRMSRLLMNFILDRSSYPMIDISVKNREKYLDALASGKSKNLTKFIYTELDNYVKEIFN